MLWSKYAPENQLKGIDTWLRERFVYVPEAIETIQAPEYMLNGLNMTGQLRGDCDDITTLHAALLTALAVRTRFIAIRSNPDDPNFDHVYLEAFDDFSGWIPYDVTVPLGTNLEWFARLQVQV